MKVVVAIDSFKGSMTSMQRETPVKRGFLRRRVRIVTVGQQPLGTGNLQQIIWMLS